MINELKHDLRRSSIYFSKGAEVNVLCLFFMMRVRDMAEFHSITKNKTRIEAYEKVSGKAIYGNDIEMEDMQYAYGVPTKYPFALVHKIDISKALEADGVCCIVTSEDLPGDKLMGEDKQDQYIFVTDRAITIGDIIALVVADTLEHAKAAGQLINVDYEPLTPLTDIHQAMESDFVINSYKDNNICSTCFIHKGNPDQPLRKEEVSVSAHYECSWQEHAYIEPEALVAYPGRRGKEVTIVGSMQSLYNPVVSIHKSLKIPMADIRVVSASIGGSFGGKLESPEVMAVRAAVAALKCNKPVKYVLTREESMQQSHKRHPFAFDITISADCDGKLTCVKESSIADGGAYANMSPGVIFKAVSHGAGPYVVPNVHIESKAIYTNNIPSGSMRGFGNPQGIYARECALDELAEKLQMSPYQLRKKNVMHRGDATGCGQVIDFEDIGAEEALDQVAEKLDYEVKYNKYRKENPGRRRRRGVGLSLSYRGNSYGTGVPDMGRCYIEVKADGTALLSIGMAEIGQGLHTTMVQIAAEALGIPDTEVRINESDTSRAPVTGICNASRGTFIGGNAILDAARQIHACMAEAVAERYGCKKETIRFENGDVWYGKDKKITFSEAVALTYASGRTPAFTGSYKTPDLKFNEKTGAGDTFYEYTWSCIGAEVEIDTCTGQTTVINMVSAHDIGRAMNPKLAEGQIIGGGVMAQGYALMEDINCVNGVARHANLDEYMIPGIMDIPEQITPVIIENPNERGPYGARSLGEPTLDPGLGAFINAVNCALGELGKIRNAPADLESVLWASGKKK